MDPSPAHESVRFGLFEFWPATGKLHRKGEPVRLQAQPARVLALLVARAGEVVTREALQREVWGEGTHVDFERGLNFCIAQVRTALGDSADVPRFIATIPRQGYRFIAPVQLVAAPTDLEDSAPGAVNPGAPAVRPWSRLLWPLAASGLLVALVLFTWWPSSVASDTVPKVIVVPFYNETGRSELDGLAKSLSDVTVARLASPERLDRLRVIGNAPRLRNPFARTDVQQAAGSLGASWVIIGQLKSDGEGLRVVAHLIRSDDMTHVWAETFDDRAFSLDVQARTAESIAAAVSQALATR